MEHGRRNGKQLLPDSKTSGKSSKDSGKKARYYATKPTRALPQAPGRALSSVERRVLDSHMELSSAARSKNLPILHDVFRKGTQNPVLRLKCALVAITSTAGALINDVIPISLNQVFRYTSWDDVWDEFRIVRSEWVYHPHGLGYPTASGRTITTCIDYDSSAALTAKSEGFSMDTGKAWSTNEKIYPGIVQPDFSPDESWYNTQTDQAVAIAYVKFFADGCSISTAYGEVFGWLDVQFRQSG
jgi:hypothetical protein